MAAVCGLGLESYLQIHKALTKDNDKVQAVTPIEECYYKVQDLKQVLAIHGLFASKINRTELLQALKGSTLINTFNDVQKSPDSTDQQHQAVASAVEGSSCAPDTSSFAVPSGADLVALGWVEDEAGVLMQPMQLLGIDLLEGFEDLPAVDTDVATLSIASHLEAPTQDHQHHQPSRSNRDVPQHHDQQQQQQHQQQQQAVPWDPALAATAAYTAGGWHMTKRSNTNSSMPDVEVQRHAIADGPAEHMQADATPAAGTVAGFQHRTTASAAAAIIKSMQGQTVTAAGAQQMPATMAHIQQQSSNVQHCPTQVQQLEQQRQQPQAQQGQSQQAPAGAESADEKEAEGDNLQPYDAADAETLLAAATAAPAHRLTQLLQEAGLQDAKHATPQPHTSWLLRQLQVFAAAGALASQESLPAPAAASLAGPMIGGGDVLLGRHVVFVLTEEMSVAGTKGKQLTMPAGVYQGRVLQYLGTSCQPELCEASCPGAHQHYRARVIPPQSPETDHIEFLGAHDAAAGIAQAQAAATGRPVRLILDLHPRLRCQKFTDMLRLDNTMLQDAWILLKEEHSSSIQLQDDNCPCREAPDVVSSVAARGRGHGRGGRVGSVVAHGPRIKRAKH